MYNNCLLNLTALPHHHTAAALSSALQKSVDQWAISSEKGLIVVTDNGANMVKAHTGEGIGETER